MRRLLLTVYERIKQRRKELGLTAEDVAAALKVSRATIYRYESAEIEKVPITALVPLAKVLCTTPAALMGWEEDQITLEEISTEAKQVAKAYDKADTGTQASVRKLLDVPSDEDILITFDVAARDGKGGSVTITKNKQTKPQGHGNVCLMRARINPIYRIV